MKNTPPCSRAFTLVEILLALAIFAVGFAMVAVVPSGALVLEKRYEQIVEGEIAANNAGEMVSARRAFWPMYEWWYASRATFGGTDGAYSKDQGTSALDINTYDYSSSLHINGPTDGSAGGLLQPLIFTGEAGVFAPDANPVTRTLDADTRGDFEDLVCNANLDNGWGAVRLNMPFEPNLFKQVFDTNQSGVGYYPGGFTTNPTFPSLYASRASYAELTWFSDYLDRTNFAKGRIHTCHNRLMPANVYPLEIRSYPTDAPLANRRIFISMGYVDVNLSANNRQWVLYAVAQTKNSGDQWPEGAIAATKDYADANAANPIAMPSPQTTGYLGPSCPMLANGYGLYDALATTYSTPSSQTARNHGLLNAYYSTNALFWNSGVLPLSGSGTDATQYPNLMHLPAIIYDWDKSLIQVAYPPDYLNTLQYDAAGTNITSVGADNDRRLKVGDHLITQEGGVQCTVKSIRLETRAAYAAVDQPYYQIVEVDPPLKSTALGGKTLGTAGTAPVAGSPDFGVDNEGHGGNAYPYWRLRAIYVAPAPAGKTISSWAWGTTISGDHFMSNNPNQ